MASQLVLFLDTSVLIHGLPIEQVDWPKHFDADEVTLVLSITVVHELDKLKDGAQGRLARDRARDFLARFKKYKGDAVTARGAEVRAGVRLRALPDEPQPRAGLDPAVQDDRIIGSVLVFMEKAPGERVALVTRDTGMELKSRLRGIEASLLPDSLERPAELDETEKELAKTKKELDRLRSRLPKIQMSILEDQQPLEKDTLEVRLIQSRPPEAADIDKALAVEKGRGWYRAAPAKGLWGFTNDPMSFHLSAFRSFLEDLSHHEEQRGRRIRIELRLQNIGTAAATIVELDLSADSPLRFASAAGAPAMPERPVYSGARRPVRPARKKAPLPALDATAVQPSAQPTVQPTKVSYRLPHLMHNDGVALTPFDVVLPRGWMENGFSLGAVVRVSELTEAQLFEFHVRTSFESVEPFVALRAPPEEDPWS